VKVYLLLKNDCTERNQFVMKHHWNPLCINENGGLQGGRGVGPYRENKGKSLKDYFFLSND